jgi:methylated-DNA-[protein]-cysteine S-methyltransferase
LPLLFQKAPSSGAFFIAKTMVAGTIEAAYLLVEKHFRGRSMQSLKTTIISPTPFGSVALVWGVMDNHPVLVRVMLSQPDLSAEAQLLALFPGLPMASCAEIEALATGLKALLDGEDIAFSLDLADMAQCLEFQQSVLRAEHQIPRGSVSTYRLIAAHLGKPTGARAVGNALATNPFPLIIPCHRAIRSDGHLGGYQGGITMKKALLEKEGIVVTEAGRVVSPKLHYGTGP